MVKRKNLEGDDYLVTRSSPPSYHTNVPSENNADLLPGPLPPIPEVTRYTHSAYHPMTNAKPFESFIEGGGPAGRMPVSKPQTIPIDFMEHSKPKLHQVSRDGYVAVVVSGI